MTDREKSIEHLLEMLNSRKASIRYEACEYLRVAPSLTSEVIQALNNACSDPDPDVAEAARRAFAAHSPKIEAETVHTDEQNEAADKSRPNAGWTGVEAGIGGIVSILVIVAAGSYFRSGCTISNYTGNLFFIFVVTWIVWMGVSSLFRSKDSSNNLAGMLFSLLVIILGAVPCISLVGFWIAPVCN